ncbi:hypothetical protein JTE90_010171 [Oedothorax gibbosus]|uniref:Uncharacterized protein n=1 Tax=Oedothorax gibbosus TaxID=931172 RepID=A0AAV6UAZ0_9ARAC|nr:hypothetical protein JTE90_010171 [Oedothorax gibbosus]
MTTVLGDFPPKSTFHPRNVPFTCHQDISNNSSFLDGGVSKKGVGNTKQWRMFASESKVSCKSGEKRFGPELCSLAVMLMDFGNKRCFGALERGIWIDGVLSIVQFKPMDFHRFNSVVVK